MPYICKTLTAVIFLVFSLTCKAQEIQVSVKTVPATCFGKDDGKIEVGIKKSNITCTVQLTKNKDSQHFIASKTVSGSDTSAVLEDLKAGNYFVNVTDNTGRTIQKEATVGEPEQLEPGAITVEKGLSAFDASDARLKANPAGGTPPYNYTWSGNTGGQNKQVITGAGQGTYICTINDANNCGPVKSTIFFYKQVHPDSIPDEGGNSKSDK